MLTVLIVVVAMVTVAISFQDGCSSSNSWQWQPSWMPARSDLYCHNECNTQNYPPNPYSGSPITEVENCCTCNSCSHWSTPSLDLIIEYVSITGKSIVLSDAPFDNSSSYQIVHTWQEMTEIPSNLCDWEAENKLNATFPNEMLDMKAYWNNIVNINFQGNNIRQLLNLNCLSRLDTLDLKDNKITYLTNTSIDQLSHLRNFDLSGNSIKAMDPKVLYSPMLNILIANLSHNNMQQVDVTNVFLGKPFCEVDISYNEITEILNVLGFELDLALQYGPGMVTLANNAIEVFPDLTELLHFDDLSQWGHLIHWGFDFRNIQLNCNCHMEPFMTLAEDIRTTLWQNYMNVTCMTPPELAGQTAVNVDPMKLVCPLDQESDCPRGCTCIDQPRTNTLYVDCSITNLNALPERLPTSDLTEFISLNVSHNHIDALANRTYLGRIKNLDLSYNAINEISEELATALENAELNLSFNKRLRKIPHNFQYRNVCTIKMEGDVLDCNCDTLWLETWMQTKYSKHCKTNLFICDIPQKGQMSVLSFNSSMIVCIPDALILYIIISVILGIILILVLSGVLAYIYWYELVITWTRFRQTTLEIHIPTFKHDVLISLNEEDDKLRIWVKEILLPVLKFNGYDTFLPNKDLQFGSERDSEIAKTMGESRTFLLILSDSYLRRPDQDSMTDRPWTENEWKYGWNKFREHKDHNLVIINYDYISAADVPHRQIKAFLRVGHVVNFGNHDITILADIRNKIGAPKPEVQRQIRDLTNCNIKFRPQTLLQRNNKYNNEKYAQQPDLIEVPPPVRETYRNRNIRFQNKMSTSDKTIKMPFHELPAMTEFPEFMQALYSRDLQQELDTSPFRADIEMLEVGLPPVFTKLNKQPETTTTNGDTSTAESDQNNSHDTNNGDVKRDSSSNNSRPLSATKMFAKVTSIENNGKLSKTNTSSTINSPPTSANSMSQNYSSPNNSHSSYAKRYAKVAPLTTGEQFTNDIKQNDVCQNADKALVKNKSSPTNSRPSSAKKIVKVAPIDNSERTFDLDNNDSKSQKLSSPINSRPSSAKQKCTKLVPVENGEQMMMHKKLKNIDDLFLKESDV